MAFPLPRGITPSEIAFLAEMEMVTVVPRQRLEGLELLGGPVEPLVPPRPSTPREYYPPAWLHPDPLSLILEVESQHQDYKNAFSPPLPLPGQPSIRDNGLAPKARPQYTPDGDRYFPSPPFLPQNTAQMTISSRDPPALPFHWVEIGNMLLEAASDDLVEADQVRRLLKDLREIRLSKMRAGVDALDAAAVGGGGVALTGVGAMEVGEERGFLSGVVDNLRKIGASKEQARREQMAEQRANGGYNGTQDEEEEEDYMEF
ncbi:DNA replication complex GINS protein psf2 [Penicillium argentinense]|uniref:DNA replication complex GINS protein PSF2 n=1 Tax=Penicillium argentinense TaxID=1131581 RepID=A0A9W9KMR5_9EURO|nr:DNA replication complex GINS protein psf2 [Penicillium argentinense]KAJ5112529.1 DNA replication complex GINS protein psf2 [Penicillium argentinense]